MTKYFTQFDESTQTIGTDLVGWTVEVGGTPGRAPAYGASTTVPVKRRYLALTTQTAGTNTLLSWDSIDADANRDKFDLLTCCILPLTTVDDNVALFARQSGGINNVYLGILTLAGGLSIYKVVAGVGTTVASAGFTVDPAKSYFLRFNGNGTALKLKAWDAALGMAGEPTAWNVSTTDGSLTAAGNVGLQCYDAAGTGEVAAFNFLAVGTNGDTAVCPRTNTEYTAWLDSQNAIRCVLAEMSATGYDSGGSPYTKTVNVYLSNHGYTSQQQDTPSLRHYDNYIQQIPTFTREMSTALSGQATTGFGDLIISNPASTTVNTGVRDNWLRMRWNRNYLKMYLGDPSWPKHDFRLMIYGRLGMPSAPSVNTIKFPIADLSDVFNAPIVTSVFSSGQYIDQVKPKLLGRPGYFEPPLTDTANLVYTIDDGAFSTGYSASDNGVEIATANLGITAVNNVNGDITSNGHGMLANYRVQWVAGTPPLGMSLGTDYWVISAGLTANVFRLSATLGGAAITGGGTGLTGTFFGYGYYFTPASGTLTLVAQPAGRVMALAVDSAGSANGSPHDIFADVIFTALGLSLNFKDAASFTALATAYSGIYGGMWLPPGKHTGSEVLPQLASGFNMWYGITPDGLVQIGAIDLPTATAALSLTESDVVSGSMRMIDVIRPIDFSVTPFSYAPWFRTGGPLESGLQGALQGKSFMSAYSYGAASTPLDDYPPSTDSNKSASIDSLAIDSTSGGTLRTKMVALYKHKLGVFEFSTRLSASQLNIGDTISLTHPRYEWKQWTGSDDASPDNTGTVEARYAVVIGIATDVAKGTTKIKCFRRIPGYYPTTDLN